MKTVLRIVVIIFAMTVLITTAIEAREVVQPGPVVSLGQFTSNLAGTGHHVIACEISLELIAKDKAIELLQTPGWIVRVRHEIFAFLRGKNYNEFTGAEGTMQLAKDIRKLLNEILPDVEGESPIVNVWFESIILQ